MAKEGRAHGQTQSQSVGKCLYPQISYGKDVEAE